MFRSGKKIPALLSAFCVALVTAQAQVSLADSETPEISETPETPDSGATQERDLSVFGEVGTRCAANVETSPRSLEVRSRLLGTPGKPGNFRRELEARGFQPGNPVYFRIFKMTTEHPKGVLEVWLSKAPLSRHSRNAPFELFKSYPIVAWSGALGPKLKEGDRQAPEGFYPITVEQLNPYSNYHLAMNTGYPNEYDRSLGRTGGEIMIHGGSESAGCYVMGDQQVEELYVLAEAAFRQCVREVPVAAFPFPLTRENLRAARSNPWFDFWENIAEGYRIFEATHLPPVVSVSNGRYYFGAP
jgi:murein L,D-transpeptidase YafK